MELKTINKVRRYKAGYEVRHEEWDDSKEGGTGIVMRSAYNPMGHYIGTPREARRLCVKRGIRPELISGEHSVCSIGFSPYTWKWYGWSHRAIFGFGVGSKVKMGDGGFIPSNKREFIEFLKLWHKDSVRKKLKIKKEVGGVSVYYAVWPKGDKRKALGSSYFEPYPEEGGRGEWEAKTMEDARQMAIDFARGVA